MKKLTVILLSMLLLIVLVGCNSTNNAEEASYTIGIAQFAEHGSLDNCREGFIAGLKEAGIEEGKNLTIDYQNAQADMGIANQIAASLTANKPNLICAIATPMAQAVFNAAEPLGIPTIFTAVTDPIAAELAKKDGTPAGEITGSSDKLPVSEQLKMIRAFLPEAKTIAIIYSTSEVNSQMCVEEYKQEAGKYGFTIKDIGINTTADIPMAADKALAEADCINNVTDNTVISSLPVIIEKAKAQNKAVFGSEIEQVKIGCVAAEGLEYFELGKKTGQLAAQVLKGEKKASELNFIQIDACELFINPDVLKSLNIEVPAEFKDKAKNALGE